MSAHLVIGDQHAHPDFDNKRADWLGRFILDIKPDVIVNIGDAADMQSLCSYDKGKRSYVGKSYEKDLGAHLDFQERVFAPLRRAKKKLPRTILIEGNHEHRIERALDLDPYLIGTIGFKDYKFDDYYDEVIRYNGGTPGTIVVDGILYSHYISSGVLGKPVSGEHPAYTTLSKKFQSCTQGHSHIFDYCIRTKADGKKIHSLVLPVYQDYCNDWAGETCALWDQGVTVKRNVAEGQYDLQFISLQALKREYDHHAI